jgi:transitional endoplasmic reticulum ATPase
LYSSYTVRIKDAYKGDAGRGRIRVDPDIIKKLNLRTGDVIEINNHVTRKKTVATLFPGKIEDKGNNSIRLDSSIRRNIESSIDDAVEIRKIEASLADRITFAGLEQSIILRTPQQLTQILENRIITIGDILSFNAMGRRIDLVVVDYHPKVDAVRIDLETKITISEKSSNELEELEKNMVNYGNIGGLDSEISQIRDLIELPLNNPEIFEKIGISPIKGLILYGPPGTGKSLLATALGYETDAHFIVINGPEIYGKYIGEAEDHLRKFFDQAKEMAPSIIFINKIDSIAPKITDVIDKAERRIVTQLGILIDAIKHDQNIFVIAETNRLEDIDDSLRRSGRFEKVIEFKLPDLEGRHEILKIHTRNMPLDENVDLLIIAEKTTGFVGADLELVVKHAGILSIKEILSDKTDNGPVPYEGLLEHKVSMDHFLKAIDSVRPMILNK